jgi:hypothetical protein
LPVRKKRMSGCTGVAIPQGRRTSNGSQNDAKPLLGNRVAEEAMELVDDVLVVVVRSPAHVQGPPDDLVALAVVGKPAIVLIGPMAGSGPRSAVLSGGKVIVSVCRLRHRDLLDAETRIHRPALLQGALSISVRFRFPQDATMRLFFSRPF